MTSDCETCDGRGWVYFGATCRDCGGMTVEERLLTKAEARLIADAAVAADPHPGDFIRDATLKAVASNAH